MYLTLEYRSEKDKHSLSPLCLWHGGKGKCETENNNAKNYHCDKHHMRTHN